MMRTERLTVERDTFASERKDILKRSDAALMKAVSDGLFRRGLSGWKDGIVAAALKVFNQVVLEESDGESPVIDTLRTDFERLLRETLEKTTAAKNPQAQAESMTRWLSTMSVNSATEAATTSDPDGSVGLEWITMADGDVRMTHQDANGQTVPSGQPFTVGGEEFLYPGEPIGDPALWMNCRCVARPTNLEGFANNTESFANVSRTSDTQEKTIEEKKHTSTVLVALPAQADPISAISSEEDGAHATLLFFGDTENVDGEALKAALQEFVEQGEVTPITDAVNGTAILGADKAQVVLLDAKNLIHIREGLAAMPVFADAINAVKQFPTWIPHVTIGYPDTPSNKGEIPETITFDRLALWNGDDKTEYPLGEAMPEPTPETKFSINEDLEEVPTEAPVDEDAPEISEEEEAVEVPWHSVLAPEGVPSGDGRMFGVEGLTHRALPLPLKAMFIDAPEHNGSGVVGRIDRIFRDNGLIKAEGIFDSSETANEAVRLLAQGMWRGISVDVDAVSVGEQDEEAGTIEFSTARIASATLCAIPAFAEAFIALGPWEEAEGEEVAEDDETPAGEPESMAVDTEAFDRAPLKTKDGPGWVTDPKPTQRITGYWVDGVGAAQIGWGVPGDFNRCRLNLGKYVKNPSHLAGLCANLHYRALGVWPGQASAGTETMNIGESTTLDGSLTASVRFADTTTTKVNADYFRNPELTSVTPLSITDEGPLKGHIFGHLATWNVCHIGIGDECVIAPESTANYAYFATGNVITDAGPVAVGQITMGGGHASANAGMRAALSHYDSTSTAVADVSVGEDEHGIWVAGKIRDGVTSEEVYALRASGVISGDWREVVVSGEPNLELCAALAVNVPGFPIPRVSIFASAGTRSSIVAAGIAVGEKALVEIESPEDAALRVERIAKARAISRAFSIQQARKLMRF